ncbi:hypothetical protein M413DRAFT_7461 [Hebeloma cylindrosporum]|uniref:Uncharacterized protein n=1 Tax=Hebeloma cylindrosporum TaxID=76867 RepID=A0A0C3CD37_HEBCY|nr:hypothetical protein M413DRAFT_7461 [Hebeloma cylindrosporum h7]
MCEGKPPPPGMLRGVRLGSPWFGDSKERLYRLQKLCHGPFWIELADYPNLRASRFEGTVCVCVAVGGSVDSLKDGVLVFLPVEPLEPCITNNIPPNEFRIQKVIFLLSPKKGARGHRSRRGELEASSEVGGGIKAVKQAQFTIGERLGSTSERPCEIKEDETIHDELLWKLRKLKCSVHMGT